MREVEEPEPGPIRRPVVRPVPKSTPPPVKLPSRRAPKESAQNSPLPTMENSSPIFRSPKPNLFIQKSAGGDIFSEEETQELINVFDDILEIQDDKIIDAWMAYSAAVRISLALSTLQLANWVLESQSYCSRMAESFYRIRGAKSNCR